MVEDRPKKFVKYCLPCSLLLWAKTIRTLQRGVCAIAEHLLFRKRRSNILNIGRQAAHSIDGCVLQVVTSCRDLRVLSSLHADEITRKCP